MVEDIKHQNKMGKFNRVKAEQIVNDVITKHITEYGDVVYTPTGCLPYENGKRVNGHFDYPTLMSKIRTELRKSFNQTQTYCDFLNVGMSSVIRKSGLRVGVCTFDINDKPTWRQPEDIVPLSIEVVRGKDIISLEEFIETI